MDLLDPLSLDYTLTIIYIYIYISTPHPTEIALKSTLLLLPLIPPLFLNTNDPFVPLRQNNYQDIEIVKIKYETRY